MKKMNDNYLDVGDLARLYDWPDESVLIVGEKFIDNHGALYDFEILYEDGLLGGANVHELEKVLNF